MIEVFTLWRHTRMVVLVALTAALYAAVLIPFKPIPIVPGFTEIRPANVVPVVCSLLFGPAAAWGSAFGNLIGDFFGTLGLGSLFGFFGNFLYGYLPYKVLGAMRPMLPRAEPGMRLREMLEYLVAALAASAACGLFIGWGVDLLGLVPFAVLANVILLNNFIVSAILGPPLVLALYPRVRRWGLLHTDIMEAGERPRRRTAVVGFVLLWLALIWGMVAGNLASLNLGGELLKGGTGQAGSATVALAAAPAIILLWLASLLL